MPATNTLRTDTRLTNVSIGVKQEGFIADDVCPILLVPKKEGLILEGDMGSFVADPGGDDRIAQGELPGILKTELTDRTYATHERAKGATVHDDEVDTDSAEDAPYEVKVAKTETATRRLLLNREVRVAALFSSGVSAGDAAYAPWNTADSDPLADVTIGQLAILDAVGLPANSAIVPWKVFQYLRNNAALKAFFSGGATSSQLGLLTMDALKTIFDVQNIYVPYAGKVKEGNMPAGRLAIGSTAISQVWGDDVYLFYKAPNPAREVISTAYTYVWKNAFRGAARNERGQYVTEDYNKRARTLTIDARTYSDEQLLIGAAAYKISSVLG